MKRLASIRGALARVLPRTRFIVLCWPRSGSYLLTDLLDQQPGVITHAEIFKPDRVELRPPYLRALGLGPEDLAQRDADPSGFVDGLVRATPAGTVGFKLFPAHNPELMERLMADARWRVVLLLRNPIQSYVSLLSARQTGKWTQRRDRASPGVEPVVFDPEGFLEHFHKQRILYEQCRDRAASDPGFKLLNIDYSQLDDPDALDRLARFLGRRRWNPAAQPTYFKQLRKPYPELVANWVDVETFCAPLGVDHEQDFATFTRAFAEHDFEAPDPTPA